MAWLKGSWRQKIYVQSSCPRNRSLDPMRPSKTVYLLCLHFGHAKRCFFVSKKWIQLTLKDITACPVLCHYNTENYLKVSMIAVVTRRISSSAMSKYFWLHTEKHLLPDKNSVSTSPGAGLESVMGWPSYPWCCLWLYYVDTSSWANLWLAYVFIRLTFFTFAETVSYVSIVWGSFPENQHACFALIIEIVISPIDFRWWLVMV